MRFHLQKQIVVMTGATNGFGKHTLKHLASMPNTRIIIGARGSNRDVPAGVEVLPLDLASLKSVRSFSIMLKQAIGDEAIDLMVFNAGIHGSSASELSEEGYGLTFAVNHLSHYYLARTLLPSMNDKSRLVITSSNMHNPPFKGIAPKSIGDLEEWAHPTPKGSGAGIRSYTASKLCNMMTALSFAELDDVKNRHIEVIAFNPGLTAGVAGRDGSAVQRMIVRLMTRTIFPVIGLFKPEFNMNSAAHSGKMLADVALGKIEPPSGHIYVSLVKGEPTFPAPSELARSKEAQEILWRESAKMVSLEM